MIGGVAPIVIGQFDIECPELMLYQDMPIHMPGIGMRVPQNLQCFMPLIDVIEHSAKDYVYLTAKKMFVGPGSMANRPGWHMDGFGTEDINYIWSDSVPTEFCLQRFVLSDDHELSLIEMEQQARQECIHTYPLRTLLKMDRHVVHRVSECKTQGYRTFAKISVSREKYNLKGNAHNYLFDYQWQMVERGEARNLPAGGRGDMTAINRMSSKNFKGAV